MVWVGTRRILSVLLVMTLLLGCSGGRTPLGPVTIRLAVDGDPVIDELIVAFQKEFPAYRIEKTGQQQSVQDLKQRIKAGDVDIVPTTYGIGELLQDDLLLPLDRYVGTDSFDVRSLGPVIDEMRWQGKLYDLPYTITPPVILYNKDMFDKAGVPPPRDGWTWDQFRAAAAKITSGSNDDKVWGLATPYPEVLVSTWLWERAGGPMGLLDEQAVREALQFFSTVVQGDKSITPAQDASPVAQVGFELGRAGMTVKPLNYIQYMNRQLTKFKWDVAPMPSHPGTQPVAPVLPQALGVAATSKRPEVAWRFLSFAAGPKGALVVTMTGGLPIYISPAVKEAWMNRQPTPPPGTESLFSTKWVAQARFLAPAQAQLFQAASIAITSSLSGKQSWEEAFSDYQLELRIRRQGSSP